MLILKNLNFINVQSWHAFLKRPENFSGPETAPQSSRNGVSQSTRKILSPKNMSFSPVNFTGTHYLPKSIFGSVFLVLA